MRVLECDIDPVYTYIAFDQRMPGYHAVQLSIHVRISVLCVRA